MRHISAQDFFGPQACAAPRNDNARKLGYLIISPQQQSQLVGVAGTLKPTDRIWNKNRPLPADVPTALGGPVILLHLEAFPSGGWRNVHFDPRAKMSLTQAASRYLFCRDYPLALVEVTIPRGIPAFIVDHALIEGSRYDVKSYFNLQEMWNTRANFHDGLIPEYFTRPIILLHTHLPAACVRFVERQCRWVDIMNKLQEGSGLPQLLQPQLDGPAVYPRHER